MPSQRRLAEKTLGTSSTHEKGPHMTPYDERLGAHPLTVPDPFGLEGDPTRLSSGRSDHDEMPVEMPVEALGEEHENSGTDDGDTVRLGELD